MQNQQTQHFATNASNSNGALTAPCSTIFVGNLGPTATTAPQTVEDELRTLFGMFPGFSRIRMHAKVPRFI
jgi:RNA recognition motif-containing protein